MQSQEKNNHPPTPGPAKRGAERPDVRAASAPRSQLASPSPMDAPGLEVPQGFLVQPQHFLLVRQVRRHGCGRSAGPSPPRGGCREGGAAPPALLRERAWSRHEPRQVRR